LDLNIICLTISKTFSEDETLFAGVDSGIFRSTNGGRAWREVDFPIDLAPVLSLALSPNYRNDGTLFAGTESQGLYHSVDNGRNWIRIGEEDIPDTVNALLLSPEFPDKGDILTLIHDKLLLSEDSGQSWSELKAGAALAENMVCLAAPQGFDPNASLLIGLAEGGVVSI